MLKDDNNIFYFLQVFYLFLSFAAMQPACSAEDLQAIADAANPGRPYIVEVL